MKSGRQKNEKKGVPTVSYTHLPEYSAEDYQALKDVLAYAKDEEKTEHEFFYDGINCNVAMARDQFITVKEQFGKTDGIQAYHGLSLIHI